MSVLMALMFLQTDPAEVFDSICDRVEKAKSLQVKARFETVLTVGGREQKTLGSFTLLLKEPGKVSFGMKSDDGTKDSGTVCDGKSMKVKVSGNWLPERSPDEGLTASYVHGLVYVGVVPSEPLLRAANPKSRGASIFRATDLKLGSDGDGQKLSYRFGVAGSEDSGSVTVWYDPKTFQVRKRSGTFTLKILGATGTFTETYEEYKPGADIDDDRFKLP